MPPRRILSVNGWNSWPHHGSVKDEQAPNASISGELVGIDRRTTKNVVDNIARLGPTDRKALAELLGTGRSTLARAVAALLDARILVEIDTEPQGRGRPQTLLAINPRAASAIGLDFGLRHIRGAIVDAARNTLATVETETPMDYTLDIAVDVATDLVGQLERSATGPIAGIGIALPGPVDRTEMSLTRSSILPEWAGLPVLPKLSTRIGYPMLADNESNLAAYAEKLWGSAREIESMVYLKLHSGVGGAIMMNEQIMRGQRGAAGEFGHLSRDDGGPLCRCGNRGCLEASIGIPPLLSKMSARHGRPISFKEAVRLVAARDEACRAVVEEAGRDAGRALGTLSNALDPQCIVVGGTLLQFDDVLLDAITAGYHDAALPMHTGIPIRRAELGRWAPALGATGFVFASGFDELLSRSWRVKD